MSTREDEAERRSILEFSPETHTYVVDGMMVPSVTQLLDDAGLTPDYTAVPYRVREHARQRGLHVDSACDLLDQDDLDWSSVHPECVPYVEAWSRFCADEGYEPVAGQIPVYHPLGYAGTADSLGRLNGQWVVVERKATARMSPLYGLQLAGYSQAPYAAPTGGGPLRPVPWGTPARLGVQLKRDGQYTLVIYDDDAEDMSAFLGIVALYRWRSLRRDAVRANGQRA
jgi:hypothetical protein